MNITVGELKKELDKIDDSNGIVLGILGKDKWYEIDALDDNNKGKSEDTFIIYIKKTI